MKSINAFLCTLVPIFCSHAQVSYTIQRDDPERVSSFRLIADPITMGICQGNAQFGFGARGQLHLFKLLIVQAGIRKSFWDAAHNDHKMLSEMSSTSKDYMATSANFSKGKLWELGAGCVVFSKLIARDLGVSLKKSVFRSGDYEYTNTTFINVKGHVYNIVYLRGGILRSHLPILLDQKFSGSGKNVDDRSEKLVFGYPGLTPPSTLKTTYVSTGYTMLNQNMTYWGVAYRSLTDLEIYTPEYGTKGNRGMWDFYADIIHASQMKFDDITHTNEETYHVYNDELKHFGWRAGMDYNSQKRFGFSMKFEVGSMPSFKSKKQTKAYCMLTLGFGFRQRLTSAQ